MLIPRTRTDEAPCTDPYLRLLPREPDEQQVAEGAWVPFKEDPTALT